MATSIAPGKLVRRLLPTGLERRAANAYRRFYIDLGALARTVGSLGPFPHLIEVGSGEGALATQITRLTASNLTGIDIAADVGVNYVGDPNRAGFRQARVEQLVAEGVTADAVLVSDVVHHVPAAERVEFLQACRALVAPGGMLIVKEWERMRNLPHALAFGSDRYLTGDKAVEFATRDELLALITGACPGLVLRCECRIPPRRNNLLLAFS